MNDPTIKVCTVCEQVLDPGDASKEGALKEYTEKPCYQCKEYIKQGDYIFVLISDKSDESRINRLHRTWVVSREEVEKAFPDLSVFEGEQVIFINESDAIDVGLLEERITDPETGIKYSDMEEDEDDDMEIGQSSIIH